MVADGRKKNWLTTWPAPSPCNAYPPMQCMSTTCILDQALFRILPSLVFFSFFLRCSGQHSTHLSRYSNSTHTHDRHPDSMIDIPANQSAKKKRHVPVEIHTHTHTQKHAAKQKQGSTRPPIHARWAPKKKKRKETQTRPSHVFIYPPLTIHLTPNT